MTTRYFGFGHISPLLAYKIILLFIINVSPTTYPEGKKEKRKEGMNDKTKEGIKGRKERRNEGMKERRKEGGRKMK